MSMETGTLRLPKKIHFGYGAREQLPQAISELGKRVFVVADPFISTTPLFAEVIAGLKQNGLTLNIYSDILPELPADSLATAAEAASQFDPDVILAYGGGSSLDAAKLVALLVRHGGPLSRFYGENAVPGPVLPIVAVPTTAGTGSEVTPVAVVSDPGREMKVGISSPFLIPEIAIVDPELTLGAPATVTAYSGIDALVHAIESMTARRIDPSWDQHLPVFCGENLLATNLSLEATTRIGRSLSRAVASPDNREARFDVAYGSLLAGMAFGSAGTHLSHALQYPIGALTKTPHGLGTGLMLPYVLQACLPAIPDRLAAIGTALGCHGGEGSPLSLAESAIDALFNLCSAIGLPRSLKEIGIGRDQLPSIAELAMQSKRLVSIAPITTDNELLRQILEAAYSGDRSAMSNSPTH